MLTDVEVLEYLNLLEAKIQSKIDKLDGRLLVSGSVKYFRTSWKDAFEKVKIAIELCRETNVEEAPHDAS